MDIQELPNELVAVFIDGSYLDRGLMAACHRADIDVGRLAESLARPRPLLRCYYYTAPAIRGATFAKFEHRDKVWKAAQEMPYVSVTLGRVKGKPPKEKGVDVLLVVDMMALAVVDAYRTAVLVGGDEDFVSAVAFVKRLGKHVEVAAFRSSVSADLRQQADRFVQLEAQQFGTRRGPWLP
jgi:uncharacterized LabA/DUF88 family protein